MITTGHQDIFVTAGGKLDDEDDNMDPVFILHKLQYFYERIKFFQNSGAYDGKNPKKPRTEVDSLISMMDILYENLSMKDVKPTSKQKLQWELTVHIPSDYFTPLMRQAYRRTIVDPLIESRNTFKLVLFSLVLVKLCEDKMSSRHTCCCSHHELLISVFTSGWNEGMQLLMETSTTYSAIGTVPSGRTALSGGTVYSGRTDPSGGTVPSGEIVPKSRIDPSGGTYPSSTSPCLLESVEATITELSASFQINKEGRERQQESLAAACMNCILMLPPHLLFSDSIVQAPSYNTLMSSAEFIRHYMCVICCHSLLPLHFTHHLLKGLLLFTTSCDKWSDKVFNPFIESSPLFLASLLYWWPQINSCDKHNDYLRSLNIMATCLHNESLPDTTLLLPHYKAMAVCLMRILMNKERSSSSIEGAITNISHQLNEVQRQFLSILVDCCIREVVYSSSSLLFVSSNEPVDRQLLDIVKCCLSLDTSLWIVLLHQKQFDSFEEVYGVRLQHKNIYDQMELFRKDFPPNINIQQMKIIMLIILTSCNKQLLEKLTNEKGFLHTFFDAHKFVFDELSKDKEYHHYEIFSSNFVQSCSSLAQRILQIIPTGVLQDWSPFCHVSLKPFLLNT